MKYRLAIIYDYEKKRRGVVRISSSGLLDQDHLRGSLGVVVTFTLLNWRLCLVFGSSRTAMGTCLFSRTSFKSLGMNSGGWLCRVSGGALTVCGGLCESDPRRRFRVDAPW